MLSGIKFCVFNGKTIKSYLPAIARLRTEVLREYPYLEERSYEDELQYLQRFVDCPKSVAVVVFDGSKIVGISTGIPLEDASPEFQKPIADAHLNVSSFYFFCESLLLEEYRGRGMAHHFYDLREEHVMQMGSFDHIGFCFVQKDDHDPKKPKDYIPLDDFWHKRGYAPHQDIHLNLARIDHGSLFLTEKKLVFWIKSLSPRLEHPHQYKNIDSSDEECSAFAERG